MTAQERARDWREKYFWLIIGLIILIGASLIAFRFRIANEALKPVGEMLGALGEALMISGILAATVDQFVEIQGNPRGDVRCVAISSQP